MSARFETQPDGNGLMFSDENPKWRKGPGNILHLWQEWVDGKQFLYYCQQAEDLMLSI